MELLLAASIAAQLVAAGWALLLFRGSGRKAGWLLLSLAFLLMIPRRGLALAELWGWIPGWGASATVRESIALLSSLLLLAGVIAMGAVFLEARRDAEAARSWAEQARRTTETLRVLSERLTLILEAAGEGVIGLDPEGRATFANRAATAILGYPAAELMGQRLHALIHHSRENGAPHPEDQCPIYDTLWHGTTHRSGEEVLWTKSGTAVPVEYVATPIRTAGSVEGAVVVFRDIHKRRRAERDRQQSEAKLRHVYEQAPLMIHTIDTDGIVRDANARWLAETGYAREEALGRPEQDFEAGDRPLSARVASDSSRWLNGQRHEVESRYRRKDGTLIDVVHDCVATTDPAGRQIHLVISRNVSEQRRIEERLRRTQRAEAVGHFASGIAHDFNNLVQVVAGATELLQWRLPAADDIQEDLSVIRSATERAASLTRALAAFSRSQILQHANLDLGALIGGLMPMLRRIVPESIAIRFEPRETTLTAWADPAQVEQVLMNLCINARDAMPSGGVLTIETGAEQLTHETLRERPWAQPGSYVTFAVADTGIGMTPETLEHVFEPFFTTKEPGRGSGLGLATAYGIVKQHEGMIQVSSEPGQGSTFRVFLPLGRGPADVTRPDRTGRTEGGRERLLIVEDQQELCNLTARQLRLLGYDVHQATEAAAALDALATGLSVDLVITDVVMPDLSGIELCRRAREHKPDLPFLFCSGYSERGGELEQAFSGDERVAFIAKPYAMRELAAKVRTVLERP